MDNAPLPFAGAAIPLAAADLASAAKALAVDVPTVEAVLTVETGGAGGFLSDGSGRPRILFEAHIFGRATGGRWNATNPDISRAEWTPGLYLGGAAEYGRLARAVALDRRAAISAASWGLFQILGTNFQAAGYTNVETFVSAMATGEAAQLLAFVSFCKANRLAELLRAHDWAAFAAKYNGPGYKANRYDEKLAAAYTRALGRSAGVAIPPAPVTDPAGVLPVLHVGSIGPLVQRVQRALRSREAQLSIDGIFGRATEAAVMRLQRDSGLTMDGFVGPKTWPAIQTLERPSGAATGS